MSKGLFIVFEGPDGSGKTTLSKMLTSQLENAEWMSFPDRTTTSGKIIDKYLKKEIELEEREIKNLFVENRWECKDTMMNKLNSGITLVCDRYVASGVAYSCARSGNVFSVDHFINDIGLPGPDMTFLIKADVSTCLFNLKGSAKERHDSEEILQRVIDLYPQVISSTNSSLNTLEYKDLKSMLSDALDAVASLPRKDTINFLSCRWS